MNRTAKTLSITKMHAVTLTIMLLLMFYYTVSVLNIQPYVFKQNLVQQQKESDVQMTEAVTVDFAPPQYDSRFPRLYDAMGLSAYMYYKQQEPMPVSLCLCC